MSYDRKPLTSEELSVFLTRHPDWQCTGRELIKTFTFRSFMDGISFVQRLARAAERLDHHPDIDIRYTKVTLRLTTHETGGLTYRDPQLAKQADLLADSE